MPRRLIPGLFFIAQFLSCPNPSPAQSPVPSSSCPCTLQGSVVDAVSNQPVPHALVRLTAPSPRATLADSEGKFQFAGLPAGRVTLAAQKPGFLSADPSGRWSMPRVEVQLAPDSPPALLKLLPEGVIAGQVSDENGEPLEGFSVSVSFYNRRGSRFQSIERNRTITDDEGKFRIAGLLPGFTYYLEARQAQTPVLSATAKSNAPAGYPPVLYPGVSDIASAIPIKALPGRTVQANLALKREPFIQLSGTVSGYTPQQQVNLSLEDFSSLPENSEIVFDSRSGSFHTKWIPPGTYTLIARSAQTVSISALGEVSNTSLLNRQSLFATLRINATSSHSDLHVVLQPTVDIPVVIHGIHGPARTDSESLQSLPVAIALIPKESGLEGPDHSVSATSPQATSPSGDLRTFFPGVASGTYEFVTESPSGASLYAESATWGSTDLLREDLVLDSSASIPPIEITVRDDGATLNGKVFSGDDPLPSRVVLLTDKRKTPIVLHISADGVFAISGLVPGLYRVFAVDSSSDVDYEDPAFLAKISSGIQEITLAPKQSASINLQLAAAGE